MALLNTCTLHEYVRLLEKLKWPPFRILIHQLIASNNIRYTLSYNLITYLILYLIIYPIISG